MEKRDLKITFSKSGAGNLTPRLSLPAKWIKEMEISQENREVEVIYENGKITIQKPNILEKIENQASNIMTSKHSAL